MTDTTTETIPLFAHAPLLGKRRSTEPRRVCISTMRATEDRRRAHTDSERPREEGCHTGLTVLFSHEWLQPFDGEEAHGPFRDTDTHNHEPAHAQHLQPASPSFESSALLFQHEPPSPWSCSSDPLSPLTPSSAAPHIALSSLILNCLHKNNARRQGHSVSHLHRAVGPPRQLYGHDPPFELPEEVLIDVLRFCDSLSLVRHADH